MYVYSLNWCEWLRFVCVCVGGGFWRKQQDRRVRALPAWRLYIHLWCELCDSSWSAQLSIIAIEGDNFSCCVGALYMSGFSYGNVHRLGLQGSGDFGCVSAGFLSDRGTQEFVSAGCKYINSSSFFYFDNKNSIKILFHLNCVPTWIHNCPASNSFSQTALLSVSSCISCLPEHA